MIDFLLYLFFVLFVLVALILILLVLIQKGRGGGLSGAFGGGGGNTAFGSKTGDVLTWATSIVFGVFMLLGVALSLVSDRYSASKKPVPPPGVVVPAGTGGSPAPSAPAEPSTAPST